MFALDGKMFKGAEVGDRHGGCLDVTSVYDGKPTATASCSGFVHVAISRGAGFVKG